MLIEFYMTTIVVIILGDSNCCLKFFTKRQILDSSKLKRSADDNFKLYENGRKVLQKGRKHCGEKGEIARYEQFLLFPQCFQMTCNADT